ncbi:hypothetical protein AMK18_07000 [Streptomyces sp. CB01249]|uniref:hypothetical protein n=1 Tax=Streptomyces sp. CB01249 TaxID=1703929 RepID=UPI00093EA480|nr:hypothetical protein [Streptomyces sp. CB01249]OKJ04915.1 hypothetical protein AMK18_07000 [Streptomyces sp. CB01249]
MGARRVAKSVAKHLGEFVMEAVGELLLGFLACLLLGGLAFVAYLSWAANPRLTVAGTALACVALAHGAWLTLRDRPTDPKDTPRRGVAAFTTGFFALTSGVTLFLAFYATGCNC